MTGSIDPLPRALRLGDQLRLDDEVWTLRGLLTVDHQPSIETTARFNTMSEYGYLTDGYEWTRWPRMTLASAALESRGPSPLDGVDGHRASERTRAVMDAVLTPRDDEPVLSPELLRDAHNAGHTVLVAGGAVRDALLGRPLARKDLDLAGTLLQVGFKLLVRRAEFAAAGGNWTRLDTPCQFLPNRDLAVIRVMDRRGQTAWEYAPLKDWWGRTERTSEPGYVYGSSFVADAHWRDLTCNTLLYDPLDGMIYDPDGRGLADLGLDGRTVRDSSVQTAPRGRWLRPIDPPDAMPPGNLVKRLARLVRQILSFKDESGDVSGVNDWCRRHEARLVQALLIDVPASRESRRLDEHTFTAELRSLLSDDWIERVRTEQAEFRDRFGPELWPVIAELLPREPVILGVTDDLDRPSPQCRAVAWLDDVGGAWELGPIEGPDDQTLTAMRRYFGRRFADYRHTLLPVRLADGREIDGALALAPRFGDGPVYVELGADMGVIQPDRPPMH